MSEWADELAGEVAERDANEVLPLVPTRAEIRRLLGDDLRFRAQYATGIRAQEVGQLRWREDGVLEVADRPLAADRETLEALRDALPLANGPCRPAALQARFAACGRNLTGQLFRHAYAVHCLEGGMDVLVLSRLLGHADLRTTQMYIPAAMAACRMAYRQFHPMRDRAERGGGEQAHLSEPDTLLLIDGAGSDRDRLMLRLLYATALRASELLGLVPADVGEDTLFVRSGKGSQDRYALVDPESRTRLLAYASGLPLGQRIFRTTRAQLFVIVKRAAAKTGLLDKYAGFSLSPHSFRHACASHCYQRGMALDLVGKMLGHTDLRNTLLYLDCPLGFQIEQYRRAHPWAARPS